MVVVSGTVMTGPAGRVVVETASVIVDIDVGVTVVVTMLVLGVPVAVTTVVEAHMERQLHAEDRTFELYDARQVGFGFDFWTARFSTVGVGLGALQAVRVEVEVDVTTVTVDVVE